MYVEPTLFKATDSRYSGMAMRMAQDLGLDALGKGGVPETPGADSSQRLHCCLRIMDGVMTIGSRWFSAYKTSN